MAHEPALPHERTAEAPRNWWLTGAIIAGVLYAAREILVPLALAILMSFVLAPLVRLLQRWRMSKGVSVAVVVVFAFGLVFGVGAFMATQLTQLAGNLPSYQTTITRKVHEAQEVISGAGSFTRLAQMLRHVNSELSAKPPEGSKDAPGTPAPAPQAAPTGPAAPPAATPDGAGTPAESRPIPVEVHQPDQTGVQLLLSWLSPLLHPFATTGLVIVFVIFILLQRQDLRNRLIRLAGSKDLHRTTAAMDDAGRRLSRLYLVQLGLNAGFGVVIGLGLMVIGVPSPFLWGAIAAIFRFVPYIGSLISAIMPILLAFAVDPGWSMALWTALLFLVTEPILGHLIEPMVQGHSTGLSPVAVVVAAAFWTWLWGPIGLVLSTPLTVCLVVLGRHIDALQSLDVMFGDRPPLSPGETFYQRMLAGDPLEAADQAETYLADHAIGDYCDTVALAGLRLAQADAARGALPAARAQDLRDSVLEVVEHLRTDEGLNWFGRLAGRKEEDEDDGDDDAHASISQPWREEGAVLCVGGRTPLDEAAAALLAAALVQDGIGARSVGPDLLSSAKLFQLGPDGVRLVCLCYLDQRSEGSVRYAVKRLRRKLPGAGFVIGLWGETDGLDQERIAASTEAAAVTTSIGQSVIFVRHMAVQAGDEPQNSQDRGRAPSAAYSATDAA
jgi:predicted PurR-regulated permease PerM